MPRPLDALPDYYKSLRDDVLPFVPDGVGRLLDVGCGAGVFAAALRDRGRAREAWGIELDEEACAYAEERLDRTFCGDALAIMPELPAGAFDLVTFTDVLEHLAWPGRALAECRRLLAPGGRVLCSLPNVRHIYALKRLVMDGDWPQEDSGTFDRTHLRFFTERSIPRFFAENGYGIERMEGINPTRRRSFYVANALLGGRLRDTAFVQYAILARPE